MSSLYRWYSHSTCGMTSFARATYDTRWVARGFDLIDVSTSESNAAMKVRVRYSERSARTADAAPGTSSLIAATTSRMAAWSGVRVSMSGL